jgi:ABC-2 type transport system permease protein
MTSMEAGRTARIEPFTVMTAIGSVTARAVLGRRRTLLMLLVAGAPVLIGLLVRLANGGGRPDRLVPTLEGLTVVTVLPIVALVFGTAALGSELDDGTAVHTLTKPIPRWTIVLPKLLVAGGLTALLLIVSTVLAGVLIGGTGSHELRITFAFAIGILVGSFVYAAIFLALSVFTSRGLIIGLAYALIWEGLLAGALPGTQLLSVREYVRGIIEMFAPAGTLHSLVGSTGLVAALVALVVITIVATLRLSVYEVRSAE